MAKNTLGFTLLEILIGLTVIGILATSAIPMMNGIIAKQALKVKVTRLDTYVDKARNLAAITECPVQMNLEPDNNNISVDIQVQLDPFLKGCSAWYSQTSSPNQRGFSATLDDVTLNNSTRLNFNAVSGVLDTQNQTRLTLNYRNKRAEISYLGIGNGVASYD